MDNRLIFSCMKSASSLPVGMDEVGVTGRACDIGRLSSKTVVLGKSGMAFIRAVMGSWGRKASTTGDLLSSRKDS